MFFALPLLAVAIAIFAIPVDREYAYNYIAKGGCQARPPWIYKQLFEDSSNIDIAFIGTSHTMGGVDDSFLQAAIDTALHANYVCRNISFCGFGRNFDYLIAKDLLQQKKPKMIVLEVRENESHAGHLSFPYLATGADLITAPKFNQSFIADIYKAFLFRLQYLRELITHEDEKRRMEMIDLQFGFNGLANAANSNDLDAALARTIAKEKNKFARAETVLEAAPMHYVDSISKLAQQNNVQLVLLYLPAYNRVVNDSDIRTKYEKYGIVLIPDSSIFMDKNNWADNEHLNTNAVQKLSPSLANSLINVLRR